MQSSLTKAIYEASPEGILVVDENGFIVSHNPQFSKIWQIPEEHLSEFTPGKGVDDTLILSAALDRVKNQQVFLARVQELYDDPDLNDHSEIPLLDGRTLERHSTALRNEEGLYLGRVWFFRDITGLKLAEENLRITQFVTDHAPDLIIWLDDKARICYANEAARLEYGYSKEELLAMSITDIDPAARIDLWPDHWRKLQDIGSLTFKTSHRRRDGSIFPIEVSANHIKFDGHELNVVFGRDITERMQIESDMRIAAVAFESTESMMITDANKVILRVNQAFTDETGYTSAETIGQTPHLLVSGTQDKKFYRNMWKSLARTGKWQGEIWDRRKNGEIYPKWLTISSVKGSNGSVTHYVGSHIDITERKAAEERLRHVTCHDPLTDLPNREGLHERMTQVLGATKRNKKMLSLMLIDLDNFKDINDTMGHLVGDQVLIQAARRLVETVRQSDIVARIGGDEFVIMLPDIESAEDAAHVAEMVLKSISAPYLINGEKLHTSPSIGICLYPDDALYGEDLIKKADVAMYHAKAAGRGNYQFFTEKLQQIALWRSSVEKDLRVALEQQQFMLYYQPQLDLRTGQLIGVEALVRWQHPTLGVVPPVEFIPIAEETGLIIPLGDWVLQEACRQLAEWRAGGIEHIKMSVNLAAQQFSDKHLPARIHELMMRHSLPANSLDLEVTESMTMRSPTEAIKMMETLNSYGQSISIDDFGTGYSSLAYLKLFPISTLKIDRAFVKDLETEPDDASICDITALLAHKLGMDVVAEGVETQAQLKFLHSIGCEKIQGYLISRPLPAAQAETFIREYSHLTGLGSIELWTPP